MASFSLSHRSLTDMLLRSGLAQTQNPSLPDGHHSLPSGNVPAYRFQAESLGYSSRGHRPRLTIARLHLPCKGNPRRELNYFGLPFQGAEIFSIHSEGVALGYYG